MDGICVSDEFMKRLEAVPEGTTMDLLVHPRCGYVLELKDEEQVLLEFADASNLL